LHEGVDLLHQAQQLREISKRHDELAFLAVDFDAMVERISALVRS
jgi:hypothetical protein